MSIAVVVSIFMTTCAYEQRHFAGERACASFLCSILAPYRFTGQEVWRQYRASAQVLTVITNHPAASHLQSHPRLVSCTLESHPCLFSHPYITFLIRRIFIYLSPSFLLHLGAHSQVGL